MAAISLLSLLLFCQTPAFSYEARNQSQDLSGTLSGMISNLTNLKQMRLNNNSLFGVIPVSLARVPQLAFLDLSFNNLTGTIPKFPARTFNVVGNPQICENHSTKTCYGSVNPLPLSFSNAPTGIIHSSKRLAVALGFGISFIAVFVLGFGFVFWKRNQNRKQSILNINDMQEEDLVRLGYLRSFSFKELQHATNNFSSKNILGAGGFGNVYRKKLGYGSFVAMKRLKDVLRFK